MAASFKELILCLFFMTSVVLFIPAYSLPKKFTTSYFDEAFSRLYGDQNLIVLKEGKSVRISLDEHTGCGFKSRSTYQYAFFSTSVKLPAANYTAGVVVTFYTSNGDVYKDSHDELDFEFLGHANNGSWVLQTNLYGNGSIGRGREERYSLPFDPSENFHNYSILWTEKTTVFYVDYVPIRVTQKVEAMAGDYPSKPMSLYATIWNGSDWATGGGKYKVDYTYAPFVSQYSNFVLQACSNSDCDDSLTTEERNKMKEFRSKYVAYSYCVDSKRYPIPLSECKNDSF